MKALKERMMVSQVGVQAVSRFSIVTLLLLIACFKALLADDPTWSRPIGLNPVKFVGYHQDIGYVVGDSTVVWLSMQNGTALDSLRTPGLVINGAHIRADKMRIYVVGYLTSSPVKSYFDHRLYTYDLESKVLLDSQDLTFLTGGGNDVEAQQQKPIGFAVSHDGRFLAIRKSGLFTPSYGVFTVSRTLLFDTDLGRAVDTVKTDAQSLDVQPYFLADTALLVISPYFIYDQHSARVSELKESMPNISSTGRYSLRVDPARLSPVQGNNTGQVYTFGALVNGTKSLSGLISWIHADHVFLGVSLGSELTPEVHDLSRDTTLLTCSGAHYGPRRASQLNDKKRLLIAGQDGVLRRWDVSGVEQEPSVRCILGQDPTERTVRSLARHGHHIFPVTSDNSFTIDWGDGTSSNCDTHIFNEPGTFIGRIISYNKGSATDTAFFTTRVMEQPISIDSALWTIYSLNAPTPWALSPDGTSIAIRHSAGFTMLSTSSPLSTEGTVYGYGEKPQWDENTSLVFASRHVKPPIDYQFYSVAGHNWNYIHRGFRHSCAFPEPMLLHDTSFSFSQQIESWSYGSVMSVVCEGLAVFNEYEVKRYRGGGVSSDGSSTLVHISESGTIDIDTTALPPGRLYASTSHIEERKLYVAIGWSSHSGAGSGGSDKLIEIDLATRSISRSFEQPVRSHLQLLGKDSLIADNHIVDLKAGEMVKTIPYTWGRPITDSELVCVDTNRLVVYDYFHDKLLYQGEELPGRILAMDYNKSARHVFVSMEVARPGPWKEYLTSAFRLPQYRSVPPPKVGIAAPFPNPISQAGQVTLPIDRAADASGLRCTLVNECGERTEVSSNCLIITPTSISLDIYCSQAYTTSGIYWVSVTDPDGVVTSQRILILR